MRVMINGESFDKFDFFTDLKMVILGRQIHVSVQVAPVEESNLVSGQIKNRFVSCNIGKLKT